MKKLIRILAISIFCSVVGIFLGLNPVSAAEVSVNDVSGNSGDVVIASIAVTPDSGFGAAQFVTSYDPQKLEYLGYTMGNALSDHEKSSGGLLDVNSNGADSGKIIFSYISTEDVKEGGALLTLKFNVKEAGTSAVNLEIPEFVNNQGEGIDVTVAKTSAMPGQSETTQQGEQTESTDAVKISSDEIKKGETVALLHYEEFQNLNATQPITWSTSDSKIAVVDDTGTVKATGNGKVTITGTQGDKTISYEMNIVGTADNIETERSSQTRVVVILSGIIGLGIIGLGFLTVRKIRKNKNEFSN